VSALLALTACSDSKSPESSAGASNASAPAQGDSGEYACSMLTKDEIGKAIAQDATDPVGNGGGPSSVASDASASGAASPAKSRCRMLSTGKERATIVSWEVAIYPTAQDAAADDATYFKGSDELVEGVGGDKAVVASNHQSATLRKGAVVAVFAYQDGSKSQADFTAELKAGALPASYVDAFQALMKAAASHL
jgi:hypothetical protein